MKVNRLNILLRCFMRVIFGLLEQMQIQTQQLLQTPCNDWLTFVNFQIISTNTKEVLNDSSFLEVELNTVITVFSLDHLNVDSELDLFEAAVRYAKAHDKRNLERSMSPVGDHRPSPGPSTSKDKVRYYQQSKKWWTLFRNLHYIIILQVHVISVYNIFPIVAQRLGGLCDTAACIGTYAVACNSARVVTQWKRNDYHYNVIIN